MEQRCSSGPVEDTDELSGSLIGNFSGSLFEPYGVEDPDVFLKAAGNVFQTVSFDVDGDNVVIIARIRDMEMLKKAVAKEINFARPAEKAEGADVWSSPDGEVAAAFIEDRIILGDANSVIKCLTARNSGQTLVTISSAATFTVTKSPIVTPVNRRRNRHGRALVEVLGERKNEQTPLTQTYTTATSFEQTGILRVTTSEFGLIGTIIEQFRSE